MCNNFIDDFEESCPMENKCCCPPVPACGTPEEELNNLSDNLCDMRVLLAEAKTNLLFLAQVLCASGYITDAEKYLLLSLDKELKGLNCRVKDSGISVNCLKQSCK